VNAGVMFEKAMAIMDDLYNTHSNILWSKTSDIMSELEFNWQFYPFSSTPNCETPTSYSSQKTLMKTGCNSATFRTNAWLSNRLS